VSSKDNNELAVYKRYDDFSDDYQWEAYIYTLIAKELCPIIDEGIAFDAFYSFIISSEGEPEDAVAVAREILVTTKQAPPSTH